MIAEVSNAFMGQWVMTLFSVLAGLGSLVAVASYFASRREVESLKQRTEADIDEVKARITKLEDASSAIRQEISGAAEKQTALGEKRSVLLHNRINPVVETLSALKASNEAFVSTFQGFTEVMVAMVNREGREQKRDGKDGSHKRDLKDGQLENI